MRCIGATVLVIALVPGARATKPTTFDDLVNRAAVARSENALPQAITLYSRALVLKPDWAEGWLSLGLLKFQTGSYVGAQDALSRYIALTPGSVQAMGMRGLCEFEMGKYARALEDIDGALSGTGEQLPQEQVLRYHAALALTRLGKFDRALNAYGWFVQRQISNPEIFRGMGLAGLRIPILPKNLRANQDLIENVGNAIYAFMSGEQEGSRRRFEELFRRSPVLENEHYIYGLLLFVLDPDAAGKEFQDETELFPANVHGHIMMAWALLMRRRADEALPHALKAEALAPRVPAAQLVLGRALSETGRPKEGVEHLSEALRLQPENLEAHIALAEAYSRAGERKQSQRERRICLDMTRDGNNRVALP